jgi:glycosyltransferase involved in cell wall biosynthesis
LDKLLGGVDIFIAPNISFLAISRQSKFILTIHDLSFEYYKKTFSYKRRLWHFFVNPRFLAQRADEIWTVSQSTRSDVMNLYKIAQRRVKVKQIIKYLDDFSKRRPLKIIEKKIRRKYHLPNKFILYLGTIEPRKNILSIIQTFEYLKKNNQNFKKYGLVIAGQLGWKYKEITEYIKKSSYAKEIILTDFVRHQDKVYLYKLATIFIFPSLYEGFGIPVLEAMKSGVPVITANNSSLPEVIGEAGLMVDVERITDIIDAVEQLVENRELREKLKEKGYQRAEYLLAESERLKLL